MQVEKILIEATYKKDNGIWVLNTDLLALKNGFTITEQTIVYFPPGQVAGNHRHPRQEAMIGIGENLFLYWKDEKDITHKEHMNEKGEIYLFIVHSLVPHAVINQSTDQSAIIYEYADDKQHDVEAIDVVSIN